MFLSILTALVALPLVLYLPGMLVSRVWLPGDDALECHYERVLISALASGWLALLLAAFGVFSLWLHMALLLLFCAALVPLARSRPLPRHRVGNRWEAVAFALVLLVALLLVARPFEAVLGARDAGVYANAGLALARTGSLVQYDPLLAQMAQQAQSDDPAVSGPAQQAMSNFLGVQNGERFIATRLYTAGFFIHEGDAPQGRIVPQHLHLTTAWIGLGASIAGLYGGLFAPGLLGLLGAWSVGMLGRRLVNGWVGVLALLLLALNSVQVWFARSPTSETTAQFLIFAGLYCFAKWQQLQPPKAQGANAAPVVYAALCGVALGQLALARIDFFLAVGPVMLYLLYCAVAHRWRRAHTALALGLGAMLLHAGLHIIFIARAYFFDTAFARLQDYAITSYLAQPFITPLLREVYHTTNRSPFKDPTLIWRELALLVLLAAVLLVVWRWRWPLQTAEHWLARGHRLFAGALALLILLLSAYAYTVRPQILDPTLVAAAPRCLLPGQWDANVVQAGGLDEDALVQTVAVSQTREEESNTCLVLQGYVGAPVEIPPPPPDVDAKRMIPLANMVRLGWYISPLGIVLGVAGFALWWWRGLNRSSWLFLLIGLLGTLFFIRDTYGTSDQTYIYILRRFVPVAYPTFSLGMAYALVALAGWGSAAAAGWLRWTRRGAAAALALLLVLFLGWTGRTVYAHVEYEGAIVGLHEIARQVAPDDVLLLRGGAPTYGHYRDVPDMIATPLRFTFGVNALVVKSSNPGTYASDLAAQVRAWRADGREVYLLLGASGGSLALPGLALEPAATFTLHLPEFEQLTDQKPKNVARLQLSFALYRLVESTPGEIGTLPPPLAADDFAAQVRGFYPPESDDTAERMYAWTHGDALLRLPWEAGRVPSALELTAAGGERPAHLGPARMCLSIQAEDAPWPASSGAFVPLECFTLSNTRQTDPRPLDAQRLPVAPTGSALLRLESAPWVPAEEDAHQHDQRPVGVQFGRLR